MDELGDIDDEGLILGLTELLGLILAEGLSEADGLIDGLIEALGEILAEALELGLVEAEGDTLALGDIEGLSEDEGDTLADGEREGDTLADGEIDALGEIDDEGLIELPISLVTSISTLQTFPPGVIPPPAYTLTSRSLIVCQVQLIEGVERVM
jgi:hypothetical protein